MQPHYPIIPQWQEQAMRYTKVISQAKQGQWMQQEEVDKRMLLESCGVWMDWATFVIQATYDVQST